MLIVVWDDAVMSSTIKQKLTLTLLFNAPLNEMSALEIGGNKSYINQGLLRHELETILVPKITETINNLASSPKNSLQLAVTGFLLPLLKKYVPEVLVALQSFVHEKNVALLAVPYYGTSLHVLSEQEFTHQLALEKDALDKFFNKRSKGLFSADGIIPQNYTDGLVVMGKPLQGEVRLSSLVNVVTAPLIAIGDQVHQTTEFSEMQEHLLAEYKGLSSHVFATEDEFLLTEWHMLGQAAMFTKADALLHFHESYDHYATYMHVLNDIAHKIRTVELGKQGQFATQPRIVASPSKLLNEGR
ncbi:hypothetical protein K9M74_05060 [Candidatus Woesearchaeota archaeon]|nr:hypothetical protein [Candidatus Woesearchaeota archaeon]